MIAQTTEADEAVAGEALERLVRRYWAAVYAYIRRTGRDVHEAADLTQGFVCDIIISRRLCDHADPQRGRFRTLLRSAVKNYLHEKYRTDRKRSLELDGPPLPLEDAQVQGSTRETPDQAFCYQWSATLIRQVLTQVKASCEADGLDAHWTVFEHRVVRPMLFDEPPTDHATLVKQLSLKDEPQSANMMITVKRRFARALYQEIGRTVIDPQQIEDELNELLHDLERPG